LEFNDPVSIASMSCALRRSMRPEDQTGPVDEQSSHDEEQSPESRSGSWRKKALLALLEAQHLEDLEAFGDEVTAVLELEMTRAREAQASAEPSSSGAEVDGRDTPAFAPGPSVPITAVSSALHSVMSKEEALRCIEAVTGVTGLLQQGLDMSLAIPEPQDVSQVHRILRAGTLLRPHKSYDLPGALAWAQSREKGHTSGIQSFGALPDVA